MKLRGFIVVLALIVSGCGESQVPTKGERAKKASRDHPVRPVRPGPQGQRVRAERAFVSSMENVVRLVLSHARRMNASSVLMRSVPEVRSSTKQITKRISGHNDQEPRSRWSSRAYRNEHRWSTIFLPFSDDLSVRRRAVLIRSEFGNIAKLATRRPERTSTLRSSHFCIQLCRREWRDCDCLTLARWILGQAPQKIGR